MTWPWVIMDECVAVTAAQPSHQSVSISNRETKSHAHPFYFCHSTPSPFRFLNCPQPGECPQVATRRRQLKEPINIPYFHQGRLLQRHHFSLFVKRVPIVTTLHQLYSRLFCCCESILLSRSLQARQEEPRHLPPTQKTPQFHILSQSPSNSLSSIHHPPSVL